LEHVFCLNHLRETRRLINLLDRSSSPWILRDSYSHLLELLKIKQVLLDSCSSKRMQAQDKHKPLDQSSQPSTDPEASKQFSDSFPLISFKSQQVMSPTAAFDMLEPQKRTLLLTGKDCSMGLLDAS